MVTYGAVSLASLNLVKTKHVRVEETALVHDIVPLLLVWPSCTCATRVRRLERIGVEDALCRLSSDQLPFALPRDFEPEEASTRLTSLQ